MPVQIRPYRDGDAPLLFRVFHASVHGLAPGFYSQQQLDAWAPTDFAPQEWAAKLDRLQPFVAEIDGRPVGYADVQADGFIDHFFVAATSARQGIGSLLLLRLQQQAAERGLSRLYADVSLAAEAFFNRHGFETMRRNTVTVRGTRFDNLRMRKTL